MNIFIEMCQGLGLELVLFPGIFSKESYWRGGFAKYVLIQELAKFV